MFFLLRTAFWLTLVLVLLPLGSDGEQTVEEKLDPVSAYLAAQATMSDLGGFCQRNPEACETGSDALTAIGSRAREGARIVYEFLDTQLAESSTGDGLVTGSTASAVEDRFQHNYAGAQSWQPDLNKVSTGETTFGPVPRPKPRSGRNT
ncbi:DUF5330 domain-containing protein [Roseibium aggregatum]|uniref:DUF5330 domain-containing protein n=1 Tax=Roseibium aggregatum TaxID=187304 RepID=A0A939EE72_9HYPH|nr:DUF5330 domain-containing protein [Roseibium aggregatum]MBN9671136.1 DUF5330 domain-containing protein [Roseibium aggregatum]